jgi:hypothetical protein
VVFTTGFEDAYYGLGERLATGYDVGKKLISS